MGEKTGGRGEEVKIGRKSCATVHLWNQFSPSTFRQVLGIKMLSASLNSKQVYPLSHPADLYKSFHIFSQVKLILFPHIVNHFSVSLLTLYRAFFLFQISVSKYSSIYHYFILWLYLVSSSHA